MGLPVKKLVVPVNDNDAFPRFLASGRYEKIVPSRNSVSNAMNVGHPSNLARLVAIYGGQMDETGKIHRQPDLAAMRRDLFSSSVSDDRTRQPSRMSGTNTNCCSNRTVRLRGAVFSTGRNIESLDGLPAVILETANPAKFPEEIERMMGWSPDIPPAMEATNKMPEDFDRMDADYREVSRVSCPMSRGLIVDAFLASFPVSENLSWP